MHYRDPIVQNWSKLGVNYVKFAFYDEVHFVRFGKILVDKQFYYKRPSMYKFINMISSNNKSILINLIYIIAKYIKESIKIRNDIINDNSLEC